MKHWSIIISAATLIALCLGCKQSYPEDRGVVASEGLMTDTTGISVLDETIPQSHVEVYEELHENIYEITDDSAVIFVGRVVDYRERLIVSRSDPDEPREKQFVADGIVLEADEVLLGAMPDEGSRITIGVWALTELPDGTPLSRHTGREIRLFEDGIRALSSGNSPQYLVYANASTGHRGAQLGLYTINTRGGVVRIIEEESFGEGLDFPFVEVWAPDEEGEHQWMLPYDLQDARDAAELAKGGIEDTTGPPEEQTPGLEEDPTEQSDDGSEKVDPDGGGTPGTDGDDADAGDDADTDTGDDADTGDEGTGDSGDLSETQDGDGGDRVPDAGDPSDAESSDVDSGSPDAEDQVGQENGGLGVDSPGG